MLHVKKSVTINLPRHEVYRFWRELDNLPRFMIHLKSVTTIGRQRSHWVAKAPAGTTVEWDAEIVDDRADEFIAWLFVEGASVPNQGSVRFVQAPGDRGTEVHVDLAYQAPAGSVGVTLAKLFGEEPGQQVRDDLRRFKQVMETGEVVRSDGSLEGAGQGVFKQRPSQAPAAEEVRS